MVPPTWNSCGLFSTLCTRKLGRQATGGSSTTCSSTGQAHLRPSVLVTGIVSWQQATDSLTHLRHQSLPVSCPSELSLAPGTSPCHIPPLTNMLGRQGSGQWMLPGVLLC